MYTLNQPTAADLIAQFNIVDLFNEHGVTLKKSGRELVCLCPFHDEKTPSCYINEAKQGFHCRGCGAGGGVVSFFQQYYNVDKGEAFRMMRSRLGLDNGKPLEAAPVRLTEKGAMSAELMANAVIEEPYFFYEYGLVVANHYVNDGQAVVQLCAHGKPTDFILENDLRNGKLTDEGVAIIGQYSQDVCVCTDYIDALYLSQKLDRNIMFVFCGHPSRLPWAIDFVRQQYKGARVCAAVPKIWDHEKYADFIDAPVIKPQDEGFWCEKNRRQVVS